jgi:hypothetical protein
MNYDDLLHCEGVGRIQLEERVVRLVLALSRLEERLQARADNAARLADHPDPTVRVAGAVRESAYRTALADVRSSLDGK